MKSIPDIASLYKAQFKTTFATHLQYRIALLIWLIEMVIEPVVYLIVWSTVARSTGGQTGGMAPVDFAAYYIVFMIVNHLTFTWIMWEFDYRIRTGYFSFYLLRPIHPIHQDIADNLTYKVLTAFIILPLAGILSLIFKPSLKLISFNWVLFLPAVILAFFLRFIFEWTIALAAFWTNRVSAINQVYYTMLIFMSGEIAPLALLPSSLQSIAAFLPFRWMIAFPVELATGHCTPETIVLGFGAQFIWIAVSLVLLKIIWHYSLRKYSAVGA